MRLYSSVMRCLMKAILTASALTERSITVELFAAHKNWANRPEDERFTSLADLHAAVEARDNMSFEKMVPVDTLKRMVPTVVDDKLLTLASPTGTSAALTHWSTGQLFASLEIPRPFLAKLSTDIATDVVRDRWARALTAIPNRLFIAQNGDTAVRSFNGSRYERLWDSEVTLALQQHLPEGWRNPVAYAGGKWGAELVPSGLYAGDRDMFGFFIDGGDALDLGPRAQLHRGFYVSNSEVGAASFDVTQFYFNRVCGNNIIWGASDVVSMRARHTAAVREAFGGFVAWLKRGAGFDQSQNIAACVRDAMDDVFARPMDLLRSDDGDLLQHDPTFQRLGRMKFSGPEIRGALTAMEREEQEGGLRGTRWDWMQGFTALARTRTNVDSRLDLEERAAKAFLVAASN